MTGPAHYNSAQSWLFKAEHADARGKGETAESCAAIAQVHATLALAAATVNPDVSKEAWRKAVSEA